MYSMTASTFSVSFMVTKPSDPTRWQHGGDNKPSADNLSLTHQF
jgi:hypothetical protein